jgi:hypothetical protein
MKDSSQACCLTPVLPTIHEEEVEGSCFVVSHGQVSISTIWKQLKAKKTGGMTEVAAYWSLNSITNTG